MAIRTRLPPPRSAPTARQWITGSGDNTVRLWSASTGQKISVLRGHEQAVDFADFSPDGKTIVTASWDGSARLWDTIANTVLVLRGHQHFVFTARFSPDGRTVVTASEDQTARLWDVTTGKEIATLRGHERKVSWATFSPDGRTVVTTSFDETARLWDSATGRETAILRGHESGVFFADFSPDGRTIVTASNDETVRLWDPATGKEIATLGGQQVRLTGARFSPDGRTIRHRLQRRYRPAVGPGYREGDHHPARPPGSRSNLRRSVPTARLWSPRPTTRRPGIWDVATGQEIAVLRGHEDRVTRARISPDGRIVATASADKTARLWDAATGQEIVTLRGHEAEIYYGGIQPRRQDCGHRLGGSHSPSMADGNALARRAYLRGLPAPGADRPGASALSVRGSAHGSECAPMSIGAVPGRASRDA